MTGTISLRFNYSWSCGRFPSILRSSSFVERFSDCPKVAASPQTGTLDGNLAIWVLRGCPPVARLASLDRDRASWEGCEGQFELSVPVQNFERDSQMDEGTEAMVKKVVGCSAKNNRYNHHTQGRGPCSHHGPRLWARRHDQRRRHQQSPQQPSQKEHESRRSRRMLMSKVTEKEKFRNILRCLQPADTGDHSQAADSDPPQAADIAPGLERPEHLRIDPRVEEEANDRAIHSGHTDAMGSRSVRRPRRPRPVKTASVRIETSQCG